MPRGFRRFFAFLLAFALAFAGGGVSYARSGAGPEIGELPTGAPGPKPATGPLLTAPHDVPTIVAAAKDIPPVPSSYVKKDLGWLQLSYPPSANERVAPIIRDADAVKAELVEALGQPVLERVEVRIALTTADMARLAPVNAPPPEYASGVAYNGMHFVLISMLQPRGAEAVDVEETFRHEMAHVALEDAVGGHHVPVWFNEGLAITLSNENAFARTQTLATATLHGTLIPLSDLDRSFPRDNHEVSIAYAQAADFMKFLRRRSDHARFVSMIERVKDGQAFDRAIADAYGSDLRKLEFQWRSELERRFSIIPALTGGGLIWVLVIGALVFAYVRRRRRSKAILEKWEREEAIEDALAARAAAVADADATAADKAAAAVSIRRVSVKVAPAKVEHDGSWHTLH
jgi:hypothetical protein